MSAQRIFICIYIFLFTTTVNNGIIKSRMNKKNGQQYARELVAPLNIILLILRFTVISHTMIFIEWIFNARIVHRKAHQLQYLLLIGSR